MLTPLTRLTRKEEQFVWTDACEQLFLTLKERFTTTPVLSLLDGHYVFIVFSDASGIGLGYLLMQRGRVIEYVFRQLKDYSQNYSTHDLELGTIMLPLNIWRHYLYRVSFQLFTDHKSLKYIFKPKDLNNTQCK